MQVSVNAGQGNDNISLDFLVIIIQAWNFRYFTYSRSNLTKLTNTLLGRNVIALWANFPKEKHLALDK